MWLVCARDEAALDRARTELESAAPEPGSVATIAADVSEPESVERLVGLCRRALLADRRTREQRGRLRAEGLVEEVDWDEWEHAVRVNLFGSVLCCRAVLPHFRANGYGKIIQLSGGGATSPLPRLSAYAASKAAVVRFAETLAEELRGHGIDVNAVAPGALNTRLLDEVLEAGPRRVGDSFYERAVEQRSSGGTPLDLPSRLVVFLASGASDGISGKLISAPWDPWEELPSRADDLRETDVYTLRRIVPADRGLSWGLSSQVRGRIVSPMIRLALTDGIRKGK